MPIKVAAMVMSKGKRPLMAVLYDEVVRKDWEDRSDELFQRFVGWGGFYCRVWTSAAVCVSGPLRESLSA